MTDTPEEFVTFRIVPFHASLVRGATLRFEPPLIELASNRLGFHYWWRVLQGVYPLPNPYMFPKLSALNDEEREVVERFVETCEELASMTLLSHKGGFRVSRGPEGDALDVDMPSREAIRGGTVLFRQAHSDGEEASWNKVRKILERRTHQHDPSTEPQSPIWLLKSWRDTRGKLIDHLAREEADRLVERSQRSPAFRDSPLISPSGTRPSELISTFAYGDLIHWGKHREAHRLLKDDETGYTIDLFKFIESVVQLSHFYLGYCVIARRALGRAG